MYHVLMVVMAIALAALLAIGGASYIKHDAAIRTEVSRNLEAQADILVGTIHVYKSANNGYYPTTLPKLKTYLPGGKLPELPSSLRDFAWEDPIEVDGIDALCLSGSNPEGINEDVLFSLAVFAKRQANDNTGTVILTDDCSNWDDTQSDSYYCDRASIKPTSKATEMSADRFGEVWDRSPTCGIQRISPATKAAIIIKDR